MSTLEQRKKYYQQSIIDAHKRSLMKARIEFNDSFCKDEEKLIELTEKLPNWQSYLTEKQLKILQLYISYRNTSAIDNQLKLTNGVSYHTLFGNNKNGKNVEGGVLKKLSKVYEIYLKIQNKKKN